MPSRSSRSATFGPTPASVSTEASGSIRGRVGSAGRCPRPRTRSTGRLRLAVPVAQGLDAPDDADAAQGDLARPRVVGDVVGLARAVREVDEVGATGAERVRRRRVPGGRPTTCPGRTGCSSSPRRSVPSPSRTTKISSSAEWQCGGQPIAAGGDGHVREAGADGARPAVPRSRSLKSESPCSSSSGSTSATLTIEAGRSAGTPPPRARRQRPRGCTGRLSAPTWSHRRRPGYIHATPARGSTVFPCGARWPKASTLRPSGPARSVCASSCGRWTRQSPAPTS